MKLKTALTVRTRGFKPSPWEIEAPDPNRMVGWKGLAEHVGVSLKTAQRWVRDGKLPKPVKLGKRKVGFRIADVDAKLA